jgi:hypothetical protein
MHSALDVDKPSVVFVFGRTNLGAESLSTFASSLTGIARNVQTASAVHTHVAGVDSAATVVKEVNKLHGARPLEITLQEFSNTWNPPAKQSTSKSAQKRARALAKANVWIVKVDATKTDPADMDSAVARAIEHDSFGCVLVTALRSVDEVILEREVFHRRRTEIMEQAGHRKLEALEVYKYSRRLANNNNNAQAVYYVSMTPNILAGILFTLLFAFVITVAINCMGSIKGQDVYVSKLPSIGREA